MTEKAEEKKKRHSRAIPFDLRFSCFFFLLDSVIYSLHPISSSFLGGSCPAVSRVIPIASALMFSGFLSFLFFLFSPLHFIPSRPEICPFRRPILYSRTRRPPYYYSTTTIHIRSNDTIQVSSLPSLSATYTTAMAERWSLFIFLFVCKRRQKQNKNKTRILYSRECARWEPARF